jgi:DNA-binding NtrC family response regulator
MGTDRSAPPGFAGTQVRTDARGAAIVAHRHLLRVIAGPDAGVEREVQATHVVIGSAAGADLVLHDATVSRRHCEIRVEGDRWVLRDLGSTNGTTIDGIPVREAVLAARTKMKVGDTEILFEPKKKWVRVEAAAEGRFGDLVAESAAMRAVFGMLERVAPTDLSVLVLGETGTGKDLAARAIHGASRRAAGPFVVIDCAAVSNTLIESELFGHEKGAFTGADRARAGAFEAAAGGTVFLDEIGELPVDLQPKLLRALEAREVKRLGSHDLVPIDVRVVAATHRDLRTAATAGAFRADLYYRLAEVVVALPPLRDRREDVRPIAERILEDESRRGSTVRAIAADAQAWLAGQPWPGNARELRNTLRRAIALARADTLSTAELGAATSPMDPERRPDAAAASSAPDCAPGVPGFDATPAGLGADLPIREAREVWMAAMERQYLQALMAKHAGDLGKAAKAAGLHRKSLRRLLNQHGLPVDE